MIGFGNLGRLGLLGGQSGGSLLLASLRARLADPALGVVEWLCAHDVASMATTYTGVTPPVVGGADTVGRMSGQSQAYVLGANLLTNGDFANGTTGWTGQTATLSIDSGRLAVTNTAINGAGYQTVSSTAGRFYLVGSILTSSTATAGRMVGNGGFYPVFYTPSNAIRAASTTLTFYCRSAGAIGSVSYHDNCFLQLVAGYHAEAVLDSARPRLLQTDAVKYLYHTSGQALTAYLPASVGATCTVIYVPPGGSPVVVTGVSVTSQTVTLAYTSYCALAILPSSASAEQIAAVSAILAPLAYRSVA